MTKKLSEMTLEELWQLFPIELVPNNTEFIETYDGEKQRMDAALTEAHLKKKVYRISHIGSSAVPGILTKNVVDILLEVTNLEHFDPVVQVLENEGWGVMSRRVDVGDASQISLNKGYTEAGYAKEVFHLHLRVKGDWNEPYFRDYLVDYPDVCNLYEALKIDLAKRYKHNRDEYTHQKTDFVNHYSEVAKALYGKRYV